ncbi:hypothetical protein IL306_015054 [Fusarium sp. DS 682]|nr:hypothetical protein IL306_015054 [Fusarium sp. DS 682]
MSGSVVAAPLPEGGHLTSTVGCLLQVDSRYYGLTAAHLVHRESLQGTRKPLCGGTYCTNGVQGTLQRPDEASIITRARDSASDDGSSMTTGDNTAVSAYTGHTSLQDLDLDYQINDGDDDFVDDIDYDDLEENDQEEPTATKDGELHTISFENDQERKTTILAPSSCSKFCTCCDVPDNDWALVLMDSKEPQFPNAFFDTSNMSNPAFFSSTPGNLPVEETPVLILTSNQRLLKGMLQPVPSFLGGVIRKVQAEYWTVILPKGAALRAGDSGSIVIGADSPTFVYGHVVASNPLGDVYVSPLGATMRQIAGLLATTHVSLPEPLPLLTGLASYYLEKGDEYAFKVLKYLDDCIHANQQSSDWPSLESWALCYQRDELLKAVKHSLQAEKDPTKISGQVRLLQKFSPDHSEKVLGFDLVMSLETESTALSTALKSRTSTVFTESTADSDYEFDTPQQETMTPKEPWSRSRNSLDKHSSAPDTILGISEQNFEGGRTEKKSKADIKRHIRFENESHSSESADQASHIDEDRGNIQDSGELSQQRPSPSYAFGLQRRSSIDEDMFNQYLLASKSSQPPSYSFSVRAPKPSHSSGKEGIGGTRALTSDQGIAPVQHETLPEYYCDIDLESVFMCKMEIEHTTKRADDRQWRMIYATLHGTALNIYSVKRSWQWRHDKGHSNVNPDNPPWIFKGRLEKSYSLMHSECGIAADYRKRRYVIRLRVEADQFLISSVQLETFIAWLDGLNAAINVASPIEDRDFPPDMSIPRIQRIRWFRGHEPSPILDLDHLSQTDSGQLIGDDSISGLSETATATLPNLESRWNPTDSFTNDSIDADIGKWAPQHKWSRAQDMLYAKLCYSNLLFKSPRKSNFIIFKRKRWYVDWSTGRMVRVLPPAYAEIDYTGPWQVVRTDNRLI